ncbi:DUF3343 domain-containing protein [Gorillibacterium massiliense]|uniref:DUF3343 domain-containing protein n=1 Tax=Gorillibacterium massiliense TaxID=1280390 RepID=UPI0004AD082B|nr:DUF3343 domain-containing protein [Gorillibacterium massiliense]
MTQAKYLIAFDSTQQALRAEMLLDYAEVESDTRPTPREITAGCALSIEFPEGDLEKVQALFREEKVAIRGIFTYNGSAYEVVQ